MVYIEQYNNSRCLYTFILSQGFDFNVTGVMFLNGIFYYYYFHLFLVSQMKFKAGGITYLEIIL